MHRKLLLLFQLKLQPLSRIFSAEGSTAESHHVQFGGPLPANRQVLFLPQNLSAVECWAPDRSFGAAELPIHQPPGYLEVTGDRPAQTLLPVLTLHV